MTGSLSIRVQRLWQTRGAFAWLMLPLAVFYCFVMRLRRWAYAAGWLGSRRVPAPVIVVGNLSVGGTGKTPLVIWLVNELTKAGYRPGVVSRGYGGNEQALPMLVDAATTPAVAGDEPVLIRRETGRPVAVAPDRVAAAHMLLEMTDCDVIVADDGLQHLRLRRDIDIAVIASDRIAGNGWCLPAGPLRESASVLRQVDIVVSRARPSRHTDWHMDILPDQCISLQAPKQRQDLAAFSGRRVHAVAGLGNPEAFFHSLRDAGIDVIEHRFPDHHAYRRADLEYGDACPVIMTAKDAVKCRDFAGPHWWYLSVRPVVDAGILEYILNRLEEIRHRGQETA